MNYSCLTNLSSIVSISSKNNKKISLMKINELRFCEKEESLLLPKNTLIKRAGKAAAKWIYNLNYNKKKFSKTIIYIAVGPGNNGCDALIAGYYLKKFGASVHAWMPKKIQSNSGEWAIKRAKLIGVFIHTDIRDSLFIYDWIIDGMFGIGLTRPLLGSFSIMAKKISNKSSYCGQVLSIDIPSGINSDNGNIIGGGINAVYATHTITFISAKPGLFMVHGRDYSGFIGIANLGIDTSKYNFNKIFLNTTNFFSSYILNRDYSSNKGTFGKLAIFGGNSFMSGAPIMAGRAALYSGAGKIFIIMNNFSQAYDCQFPELIFCSNNNFKLHNINSIIIGCGLGKSIYSYNIIKKLLNINHTPILFDADALNIISENDYFIKKMYLTKASNFILTPHPLEAARLLKTDVTYIQKDRISAAKELALKFSSTIVLKGIGTVIVSKDGNYVMINPTGNASLATSGMGDVLSGIIGSLIAQGLPSYEASLAGVYLHGLSADIVSSKYKGCVGVTTNEISMNVRILINKLLNKYSPRNYI